MACDCNGSCGLSSVPTRDLVAELATREGVDRYPVGVEGLYQLLITHPGMGCCEAVDRGPATVLVVVD